MPSYDYQCPKCQHEETLWHSMAECDKRHLCPKCREAMARIVCAPAVRMDTGDWSDLNGGRGFHNKQFDAENGDQTHFRSRSEMIDYMKGPYAAKVAKETGRTVNVTRG